MEVSFFKQFVGFSTMFFHEYFADFHADFDETGTYNLVPNKCPLFSLFLRAWGA